MKENAQKRKSCFSFLLLIFTFVFLLSACQKNLYQDLTEQQVNEMLALLLKYEMKAEKVSQGKGLFTLTVDEKELIQSLEILNKNNLPRPTYTNLGEIFKGDSMISSSTEESARMAYAISQELSETFSRIDGVLTARVHIVLGSTDPSTDVYTKPSAAVFFRHVPDSAVTSNIARVKEITAKAVPNLQFEDISVMLIPVREEISVPLMQNKSLYEKISDSGHGLVIIGVLCIIFLAAIVYLVHVSVDLWMKKSNKNNEQKTEE